MTVDAPSRAEESRTIEVLRRLKSQLEIEDVHDADWLPHPSCAQRVPSVGTDLQPRMEHVDGVARRGGEDLAGIETLDDQSVVVRGAVHKDRRSVGEASHRTGYSYAFAQ
jgi:hypothetical protein